VAGWVINLVCYLRAEESEQLRGAGKLSEGARIAANRAFAAEVTRSSGDVTVIRWRVADLFLLAFGWLLVAFFIIGVALAAYGLLRLSSEWALGGTLFCAVTLLMSRWIVLLFRPRRQTLPLAGDRMRLKLLLLSLASNFVRNQP
jgi:hypothetical protein